MYAIKAVAAFAALALFGSASAKCYDSGQEASAATIAAVSKDAQLGTACSSLVGTYARHEDRETCIEIGGNKYKFKLKYNAADGWLFNPAPTRAIGLDECKNGMAKEVSCSRGGKTMYTNWEYQADYNLGKCSEPFGGGGGKRNVEPEAEVLERLHGRAFAA